MLSLLSPRLAELQSHLMMSALSSKQIAHQMGLSAGSVKVYSHRLYANLGVRSRAELQLNEIKRLRSALAKSLELLEKQLTKNL